jgi:hypothetical protein
MGGYRSPAERNAEGVAGGGHGERAGSSPVISQL